ncbi:MAG: hypothetical protein HUU50_04520 [Candidatus Brocadiae bacterium]|nr:hypothetical protein [Candidatus Brocadiia bacterium]
MLKSLFLFSLLILSMSLYAGPVSTLYGTGWANGSLHIFQGNTLTKTALQGSYESGIVVLDTVKTYPYYYGGSYGRDYSLSTGNVVNTTQHPILAPQGVLDATTNGQYIYAMSYAYTPGVYRFNLDWTNPQFLFSTASSADLGIAYDSASDLLWVTNWGNKTISKYSMSGSNLGSFSTVGNHNGGLAYDAADNTLWTWSYDNNRLEQYSKTGTFLSSTSYAFNGHIYGLEASVIPEPHTLFFVLLSCAFAFFLKKK